MAGYTAGVLKQYGHFYGTSWALSSDDSNEGTAVALAHDARDILALNLKLLPGTPPYGAVNADFNGDRSFMSQDGTLPLSPLSATLENLMGTPSMGSARHSYQQPFSQPGSSKAFQAQFGNPMQDLLDFNPLAAPPIPRLEPSNGLVGLPSPASILGEHPQAAIDTVTVVPAVPAAQSPGSPGKALPAMQPPAKPPARGRMAANKPAAQPPSDSSWPGPITPFTIVRSLEVRQGLQDVNAAIQRRESALVELPNKLNTTQQQAAGPSSKPKAGTHKKRQRKH